MKKCLKKYALCSIYTLREESSQTNVILQYKLLAAILSGMGHMTLKLQRIRPYFSYSVLCY